MYKQWFLADFNQGYAVPPIFILSIQLFAFGNFDLIKSDYASKLNSSDEILLFAIF